MTTKNKNTKKQKIGLGLMLISLPGLLYPLIVSIGGGVFFLFVFLAYWLYWLPAFVLLLIGLKLYRGRNP